MCTRDAEQGCELRKSSFFFSCKSAWPSLLAGCCCSVHVVNFCENSCYFVYVDVRYCRGMNVCMMIVTWTFFGSVFLRICNLQFCVLLLHELYLSRESWWGMVKSHACTCVDPLTICFTFRMAIVSTVSLF